VPQASDSANAQSIAVQQQHARLVDQRPRHGLKVFPRDGGVDVLERIARLVHADRLVNGRLEALAALLHGLLLLMEMLQVAPAQVADPADLFPGQGAVVQQPPLVDRAHGRVVLDFLIQGRLGEGRLIRLVVAVAPVAVHVDDDILAEGLAVFEGQLHDPHDSLGVVAVDMKNGRLNHFGHVGAVKR